jgi:riboflavin transporter FmnP
MNATQSPTRAQWVVLWVTAILLSLVEASASGVRLAMAAILRGLLKGREFSHLTDFMMSLGPHTTTGILLLGVLTIIAFIGLGWMLKGSAREAYCLYAPSICALLAVLYMVVLLFAFLLPFGDIFVGFQTKTIHPESSWF